MSDFITASVRTISPMIVGAIVGWLVTIGIEVTSDAQAALIVLTTFIFQAVYYLAVKALEKRWPKLGVLLGVPKQPVYAGTADGGSVPDISSLPKPVDPDELTD